jgi:hypothetical protein
MNYNRQVIPLVESNKMLNLLISTTHIFPISYDIIEKILEIYLYNVKSKFVINLHLFHPLLFLIIENNYDLLISFNMLNYKTLKIPSYMKYFYFRTGKPISFQENLFTENEFVNNRLSIKELINCKCCKVHQKKNISFENNTLICHPINGMNQNKKPRCSCDCRNQLRWVFKLLLCVVEVQKLYKIRHQRRVHACIKIQQFYRKHL